MNTPTRETGQLIISVESRKAERWRYQCLAALFVAALGWSLAVKNLNDRSLIFIIVGVLVWAFYVAGLRIRWRVVSQIFDWEP